MEVLSVLSFSCRPDTHTHPSMTIVVVPSARVQWTVLLGNWLVWVCRRSKLCSQFQRCNDWASRGVDVNDYEHVLLYWKRKVTRSSVCIRAQDRLFFLVLNLCRKTRESHRSRISIRRKKKDLLTEKNLSLLTAAMICSFLFVSLQSNDIAEVNRHRVWKVLILIFTHASNTSYQSTWTEVS